MPTATRKPFESKSAGPKEKAEHKILFQHYVKSVNPNRTYAAQVKEAGNKNPYLVITEGKRDPQTGEIRKIRLFIYSEDFPAFFRMIKDAAEWIKANPVSEEVKKKRESFWAKQAEKSAAPNSKPK